MGARHTSGSGEGRSVYDQFGFEWTLLRLGAAPPSGDRLGAAARRAGLELAIVDVPLGEARDLFEAPLVLIRPDQIVARRGFDTAEAEAVVPVVAGAREVRRA